MGFALIAVLEYPGGSRGRKEFGAQWSRQRLIVTWIRWRRQGRCKNWIRDISGKKQLNLMTYYMWV